MQVTDLVQVKPQTKNTPAAFLTYNSQMYSLWKCLLASTTLLACSGGGGSAGQEGELGGDCFGNGTCNMGLSCVAETCAEVIGDEGNPCFGNDTCNGELVCLADVCVSDVDAGANQSSCGGDVPAIDGEYLLALSTPLARDALLLFAATTTIDPAASPATISMSLQPICSQEAQCTVGNYVGSPTIVAAMDLDASCGFTANITDGNIPGGANAISGSDMIANLELLVTIRRAEFYCGTAGGTLTVGGAVIPVDESTFGATGMPAGTMGTALPEPTALCDNTSAFIHTTQPVGQMRSYSPTSGGAD